jgi:hypothetical protein
MEIQAWMSRICRELLIGVARCSSDFFRKSVVKLPKSLDRL